ncbi:MAG: methionyl-tRNA formyltransferase [Pseudomonadales bacterium]
MRVVFAGTPEFAANILAPLIDSPFRPVAVFSQPDRRAGRGRQLQPSPVKQLAEQSGIAAATPTTLKEDAAINLLRSFEPDVVVVVAYGLILPKAFLDVPPMGCINVHASLLPRWRGAAPIERAYMAGDEETGVSIMQMDPGLDTGPVFSRHALPIRPGDSIESITDELCALAVPALTDVLTQLERGDAAVPEPQSEDGASYAPKLTAADREMDWTRDAHQQARHINALAARMPVRCQLMGRGLQLLHAHPVDQPAEPAAPTGQIVAHTDNTIEVQCATGRLRITSLKLEGKGTLSAKDAINGYPQLFAVGNRLS